MPQLDHPKRQPLLDELHSRPAPRIHARSRAVHLALKQPQLAANRDRADDVAQLAALSGETGLDPALHHHRFTKDGYEIRWESHTEVTTYSAFATGDELTPFPAGVGSLFPEEWEAASPAKRMAAVVVEVLPLPEDTEQIMSLLTQWLDPSRLTAVRILGGTSVLAGDFSADAEGWTRFVLLAASEVGPGRVGRTVQRVLDLETYRSLAMLGFSRAQQLGRELNTLDPELVDLVAELQDSARPADAALDDLLAVTARLEALAMAHEFRFGATRAYAAIVEDRLNALGDERCFGRQTFHEFLARRYDPAIRTVNAARDRMDRMLERSARAGDLLRTRVDVAQQAQNQALLHSMDARAETQLRLQHTVEGLSVVAISYYALGLLAYLFTPIGEHFGLEKVWIMAILTPIVVLCAWLGMRMVRARLEDGH